MSRSVIAAAVVSLVVLTGCGGTNEPSAPPTSEDALTTATTEPDVGVETTEAAPTTEAPEETDAPASDEMDQTEAGAEAFVEHYIETLSSVHAENADIDDLRALSRESCETCAAFAEAAEQQRFGHDYMRFIEADGTLLGAEARVATVVEQATDGTRIDTLFTLAWEGDQWLVSEIQLSAG